MYYTSVTTLRQRDAISQIESIEAPDGLLVNFDNVISSTTDETRADSSVGVDVVTRYPAVMRGSIVIFERRSWEPGHGYSASGDEDAVIPVPADTARQIRILEGRIATRSAGSGEENWNCIRQMRAEITALLAAVPS